MDQIPEPGDNRRIKIAPDSLAKRAPMSTERPESVDRAHDVLRATAGTLEVFFRPRQVAVVGASDTSGSVGRTLVTNLISSSFGGQVFCVNPRRSTVLGLTCYPQVAAIGAPIDLAVIAVPARSVPSAIDDCLAAGVRGAIVISAGFKEVGPAGADLEARIRRQIQGSPLRLIGPNCLGVMSPATRLNATFAPDMARPGTVALVSQSGAMLTAILDWSLTENIGFSHLVSVGSMLDVGWGDLIDYLGDDPHTKSILLYMESIGSARAFLSAAREVALQKPIIVIKAGRTERAAKAAASHTGALAGSDEALDTAFQRAGALRVSDIASLFSMAEVLAKQPLPKGPNLTIVTNAGGPGVLATDALIEAGGQLATFSAQTIAALDRLLPAHWSRVNPVDVLGDADPERYAGAARIALEAAECDGLLAIFTPQAMTDPTQTARQLAALSPSANKPVIASWMGGARVQEGIGVLNQASIPTLPYPDAAAGVFRLMWRHRQNLQSLYETPALVEGDDGTQSHPEVAKLLESVLAAGRTLLTEYESKRLLAACGIPTVETRLAATAEAAVHEARALGFPVVLKLNSTTLAHKARVGGVRLNLGTEQSVIDAFAAIQQAVERAAGPGNFAGVTVQPMIRLPGYEVIVGSSVDSQLGPLILFGAGGSAVEIFRDKALGLPPLTSTLARRMMEQTKIYAALRDEPSWDVNLARLEQLLVRFASLVLEYPRVEEIDINPLLVHAEGYLALDARVSLFPRSVADADLPRPAIRPYPRQYVGHCTTRDGRRLLVRPIRPEDEPLLVKFHESLSDNTVYLRYAQVLSLSRRTVHERLSRLCFIDYDRQMALLAIDRAGNEQQLVAVARLVRLRGTNDAEFAIVISDALQGRGLGTSLMRRLVEVGRAEGMQRIIGYIHATNRPMLAICRRLGFAISGTSSSRTAVLDLAQPAGPA